MGILKVGVGALKSVLEDSWREYFYCPGDGTGCPCQKRGKQKVK